MQDAEHQQAGQRDAENDAQIGVDQRHHQHEQRGPDHVEPGDDGRAGDERPQRRQVLERFAGCRRAALAVAQNTGLKQWRPEPPLDPGAPAHEHALANYVEQKPGPRGAERDRGEHDQRHQAATGNDPVEDLQDEERYRELGEIDEDAENENRAKTPP